VSNEADEKNNLEESNKVIVLESNTDNSNNQEEGIIVRQINGKHSIKTGEVAKLLGETPAMIGHYCREFAEHLNLDHSPGQHRTFNEENVKTLSYIVYLLKDKRMSTDQAKEFLSTPQGKLFAPIDNDEDKAKVFVDLITQQLSPILQNIVKEQISATLAELMPQTIGKSMDKLSASLIDQQTNIQTSIKQLVDESVKSLDDIRSVVGESNENAGKVVDQLTKVERQLLELRETKFNQKEEKKGILSRFFK
jgi:hypothetical protein